jgi:hypothetical protein
MDGQIHLAVLERPNDLAHEEAFEAGFVGNRRATVSARDHLDEFDVEALVAQLGRDPVRLCQRESRPASPDP